MEDISSGMHIKNGTTCDIGPAVEVVQNFLSEVKDQLYPESLKVIENSIKMTNKPKENGGWADPRDHELCLQMASPLERESQTFVKLETAKNILKKRK